MRQFQIAIPDDLHAQAKKAAAKNGITMAGLVRQALIKYLAEIGK